MSFKKNTTIYNSDINSTMLNEPCGELRERTISQNCKQQQQQQQSILQSTYEVIHDDGDKLSQQLRNDDIEIISPETHPEYFVPVAPDGGWSWIVLFATFFNYFTIDGIFFSVGLLMVEWTDHFGASKTKVSLISSLMLGCYQMIGPIAAALTNKFGCRPVALFGSCLASVSIFVSAFMPNVEMLTVTFGITAGSAFGLVYLPSLIAVSFYFNKKREIANGIAVTGTPLGAVIFAPLASFLINHYGWSCTLILLSAFMLHGICFSCLYRPLKPKSKLESLDLSKETDETTVGLIEEIQSNLIASNAFIRSNLFFNSTNRMGQTLYEVEETNEDEQHQQQLRQQQRSSNKQPCKTNEMMKDHNAKISQSDEHQNENGNGNKDEKETVKQIDKKLIQSTDISQMPLSTILPDTKRKIEVSIAEDATDNDLKAGDRQQKQQQPESEGQFATLDRNRNLIDDQSVVHTTSKMPPKSVRPRKHDSSSYVFSTPCLSVNRPYDEETGGGTAKALQDIYKKKSRQYVRNQLLPNQRLQRPVASRQRHLSHNLTPNIPTIEEDQVLTKSCAHGQLHAPTTPKEFSSSITLANLYRDRRGMPLDPNSFSSGLIPGSVISGLATYPQKLEVYKVDSKPVLVALPHQSITVEDYSRPLYRSDIFFSGNPIPNISNEQQYSPAIGLSSSGIFHKTTNQQNLKDTDMCNSRLTVQWNDTPAAPITATTTTIASALSSGHHLIDQSQPNRMESFLVSLTSIPFPNDDDDNRRDGAATGGGGGEVASMLINKQRLDEKLHKSISEYDNRLQNLTPDDVDDEDEVYATSIAAVADDNVCLSECCLTGIRRLRDGRLCPSISSCLRRLYNCFTCFTHKQKRIYKPVNKEFTDGDYDGVDGDESNSLNDDGGYDDDDVDDELPKCTPNHSVPCKSFTFKPIIDVLSTMLDLSLLREPKYLLLWISNLIGVLGLYVPLIYVSDFASIYGISSQLSSYLLSIMGGSSIVSRLLFAWISGLPHVSPLVVQTIAQFLLGVLVCAMPILTTFTGMAVAFAFYGFFSGVFSTLSTIILYNLVGMDQLTTAVGLITLSRGLSSVFGPPLAGLLFEATQGFEIPYFVAGMFIIMSALLFLLIACYNRIARLLTNLILRYDKAKTSKLHLEQQDEDGQLKQKLNKGDDDTC